MIHEILGIEDGKVVVDKDPESSRPVEERIVVLSKHHDSFWIEQKDRNFGEVCSKLQAVVAAYKEVSKSADMKTWSYRLLAEIDFVTKQVAVVVHRTQKF
jgi:hypothetical protein